MSRRKIWTAEELEVLSPTERHEIVRSGFETDLGAVSPTLLDRARRKVAAHIAATEGAATAER